MGLKCRINYEGNKPVVYNEDGTKSKLYSDALELVKDEQRALDIWAVASSEDFLKYNGVINTNDEVSLDEVFEFYNSINVLQGQLSPAERMQVSSFMRLNDIESSTELVRELKKIFRSNTGAIDFSPTQALKSGLFTESDIENIDVAKINELINKIEGTPRFDVAPADYIYKHRDNTKKTIFGTSEIIPNEVIERDVIELIDNLDSKEEFDEKIIQLPYLEIVEKYQEDETFAEEFRSRFSGIKKIPVVGIVDGRVAQVSPTLSTIKNTLRVDVDIISIDAEIDYLTNIPHDIWEESQKNVRNILKEVEEDMAGMGIDIIGLNKLSGNKDLVIDLLTSLSDMVKTQTEESMQDFSQKYDEAFGVKPGMEYMRTEDALNGLTVVKMYSDLSTEELFNQFGLIKVGENLYHKVNNNQEIGTLYEYLYQQYEDGVLKIPRKFITETNKSNKEGVLKDIEKFINSRDTGLGFFNEELSAYQVIFNHPPVLKTVDTKNRHLSLIKSDEMYLQTQFVSDFYNYILKEKLKNSVIYREVLSKFQVNDKDLTLVGFPDNNAGFEGLEMYDELVDYFRLKKGDLADLFLPTNLHGASTYQGLAINFPQEIRQIQEPHTLVRNILLTAPNSFEYQRVGNKVYSKIQEDENNAVYIEIETPKSNVYNSLYMTLTEYNQADVDALNKTQNLKRSSRNQDSLEERRRKAGLDSGFNKRMREDAEAHKKRVATEPMYQIIGERGARMLDKEQRVSNRLDNLEVAKEMESTGKTPQQIRVATGWERGSDSLWRYEVMDGEVKTIKPGTLVSKFDAQIGGNALTGLTLEQIYDSKELYTAYPTLKGVEVLVYNNTNPTWGNFYGVVINGKLYINIDRWGSGRETAVHEIQHFVQKLEGFAAGGNPNLIKQGLKEIYGSTSASSGNRITSEGFRTSLKRVVEKYIPEVTITANIQNEELLDEISRNLYSAIAGEVEANNVISRLSLSETARRSTLLADSSSISPEDQIYFQEAANELRIPQNKVFEQNLVEFIRQKGVEVVTDPIEVKRALEGTISPMIVGEVGATESNQLSQTLTQAKDLDRLGKSSEEILKKTGWIKSRGVWKTFEGGLTESLSIRVPMMGVENTFMNISDVLGENNPVLQMYPQIKDVKVKLYRSSEDGLLGYTKGREIYINLDGGSIISGSGDYREGFVGKPGYSTERDIASATLTHEISHLIQEIETFSGGASPNTGTYWLRSRYGYKSNKFYKESLEKDIQSNVFEGADKQIADLVLEGLIEAEVNNTIVGYPLYKRILGEVEANAVELAIINSGTSANQGIGQILSSYANLVGIDLENLIDVRDINFLQTPAGEVLGFEKNGVMYLDEEKLNNTTTLHELVHIYQSMIDIKASQGDKQAQAIKNKRAEVFQEFVDGWKKFHEGKVGISNLNPIIDSNNNQIGKKFTLLKTGEELKSIVEQQLELPIEDVLDISELKKITENINYDNTRIKFEINGARAGGATLYPSGNDIIQLTIHFSPSDLTKGADFFRKAVLRRVSHEAQHIYDIANGRDYGTSTSIVAEQLARDPRAVGIVSKIDATTESGENFGGLLGVSMGIYLANRGENRARVNELEENKIEDPTGVFNIEVPEDLLIGEGETIQDVIQNLTPSKAQKYYNLAAKYYFETYSPESSIMFQFVGEGNRLTAEDKRTLTEAKELEIQGKGNKNIYAKTRWMKTSQGEWIREIGDLKFKPISSEDLTEEVNYLSENKEAIYPVDIWFDTSEIGNRLGSKQISLKFKYEESSNNEARGRATTSGGEKVIEVQIEGSKDFLRSVLSGGRYGTDIIRRANDSRGSRETFKLEKNIESLVNHEFQHFLQLEGNRKVGNSPKAIFEYFVRKNADVIERTKPRTYKELAEVLGKVYNIENFLEYVNDIYRNSVGERQATEVELRLESKDTLPEDFSYAYNIDVRDVETDSVNFNILGEKGAAQLDAAEEVNFRMESLNTARNIESVTGLSPKDWMRSNYKTEEKLKIKRATGWERNAEGKWVYEEKNLEYKNLEKVLDLMLSGKEENVNFTEIIKDSEITKAYPNLTNVNIRFYADSKSGTSGYFNKQKGEIGINKSKFIETFNGEKTSSEYRRYILNQTSNLRGLLRGTISHELSHFIQNEEGFQGGGNLTTLFSSLGLMTNGAIDEGKVVDYVDSQIEKLNAEKQSIENQAGGATVDKISKIGKEVEYRNILQSIGNFTIWRNNPKSDIMSRPFYTRLAGEVTANNEAKRFLLTDEQKRNSLLSETEDVSREDQIILFNLIGSAQLLSPEAIELQNQTGFDLSSPAYAQRPGESDLQWNERLLKEVEAYFTAPKVAEKLENLKKSNPSLWQKIVDFIENLTTYLKKQIGLSDYKGDIMQMAKEEYVDALGVSVLKDKYTPPTLTSYLSRSIGEERMLAANLEFLQPIPTEEDYDSITDCRI